MTPDQLVNFIVTHLSGEEFTEDVVVTGQNFILRSTLSEDEIKASVRPLSFSAEPSGRASLKFERGVSIGVMQKAVADGSGSYSDSAVNNFIKTVEEIATAATKTPEPSFLSMEVADYLDAFELEEGYFATQINIQFQEL